MTIKELIERAKKDINALIERYNTQAGELEKLRESGAPDADAVEAARKLQAGIKSELDAKQAELAALEREAEDEAAVARLQSEVTPTDLRSDDAPQNERTVRVNGVVERENPVYRRDNAREASYFRDLFEVGRGSVEARDRLIASQERAGSSAAGSGGEFAPPIHLVEAFVEIARAGRIAADLFEHEDLPENSGSSVELPKLTGNTTPGVTETQLTTIAEGSLTSTSVSSGIAEITGKQTVPIALLRQSAVPLDRVIITDLARAYAASLDLQVLAGTGSNGQLKGLKAAGTTVTYTTTQPAQASTSTTNSFYSKVLGAQAALAGTRFLPANALLMHPRRWLWVLNGYDTNGRPLVPPSGSQVNAPGINGEPVAEGYAGEWAGLPVYVDPNIPTTYGSSTNQDVAFVLRSDDIWLWESDVETRTFDATLAEKNGILFRVLGFAALIATRHQASVQVIDGTGLVAPTF